MKTWGISIQSLCRAFQRLVLCIPPETLCCCLASHLLIQVLYTSICISVSVYVYFFNDCPFLEGRLCPSVFAFLFPELVPMLCAPFVHRSCLFHEREHMSACCFLPFILPILAEGNFSVYDVVRSVWMQGIGSERGVDWAQQGGCGRMGVVKPAVTGVRRRPGASPLGPAGTARPQGTRGDGRLEAEGAAAAPASQLFNSGSLVKHTRNSTGLILWPSIPWGTFPRMHFTGCMQN